MNADKDAAGTWAEQLEAAEQAAKADEYVQRIVILTLHLELILPVCSQSAVKLVISQEKVKKVKFPYWLPSVWTGADSNVRAINSQVTF